MTKAAIPNLFIPGSPKAATTSLAAWLGQHEKVFLPHIKEPHFFNNDRSNSKFVDDEREYLSLFAPGAGCEYILDATPGYLFSPNALGLIADYSPDAKYLITFRNYADTFFSLHQHERFLATETIADPMAAFDAAFDRRRKDRKGAKPYSKSLYYDERLRFGAQMVRSLEYVSRENILFIDFDLFKEDQEAVWKGVCAFLGIEPTPVEFVRKNARKEVPAHGLSYRFLKFAVALRNAVGLNRGTGLARKIRLRVAKEGAPPPEISPSDRERINHQFRFDRVLVENFAKEGPSLVSDKFFQSKNANS